MSICLVGSIRYNPKVREYIAALPEELREEVIGTLQYLEQYGRQAVLPEVHHNIAGSRDLTETRNQMTINGRRYTIRCLLVLHSDTDLLACVIRDKDSYQAPSGRDWYLDFVPVARAVYDHMKGTL